MTALTAAVCVAAFFLLIGMIKLSGEAVYDHDGFRLQAKIGLIPIRTPKDKKKKSVSSGEKSEKLTAVQSREKLRPLIKAGYAVLCRLVHHVKVDRLCISFTAADPDPANAAMLYSGSALALDALKEIGKGNIRRQELSARVDFDRETPEISGSIALSVRLYRAFGLSAVFLYEYLRSCKKLKKENNDNVRPSDQ